MQGRPDPRAPAVVPVEARAAVSLPPLLLAHSQQQLQYGVVQEEVDIQEYHDQRQSQQGKLRDKVLQIQVS
jgi:hypothetical protein